ncbi:MAG: hypothetical protein MJ229_01345 [bacterium]|nr:hypothetical protein [bacterium]
MIDFIQNLILNIQHSIICCLKSKKTKTAQKSRKFCTNGVNVSFSTKNAKIKTKLEANITTILAKHKNNPDKLVAMIRKNGTPVYKIPFAQKLLKLASLETGLIISNTGLKALYLNLITSGKFSCQTETMFIIDKKPVDKIWMIQQFHKWYAMKLNLPGFDETSQGKLSEFITSGVARTEDLTIDEILNLKDAILRDVESINFAIDLVKKTDSSKEALNKITSGGASI